MPACLECYNFLHLQEFIVYVITFIRQSSTQKSNNILPKYEGIYHIMLTSVFLVWNSQTFVFNTKQNNNFMRKFVYVILHDNVAKWR